MMGTATLNVTFPDMTICTDVNSVQRYLLPGPQNISYDKKYSLHYFFPYSAEALRRDTQVGGNILVGRSLNDIRLFIEHFNVALLGGF